MQVRSFWRAVATSVAIIGAALPLLIMPAAGAANVDAGKAPPQGVAQQIPDPYKLNMLIRTTLIALSQANQTGNYSVLRDLGTPQFQAVNSSARLAEIFAALRARKLDFSPVLFFEAQFARAPAFEGSVLRLTGLIPTKPERILFEMGFEGIDGLWRLSAIVIDMQQAPAETPANAPPQKPDAAPDKAATQPKR